MLLLAVPPSGPIGDVVLPLLVGSVVRSEENVLIVDRELELELELLELRIVTPVLSGNLVLDDKELEPPVPLPVAVEKGGIILEETGVPVDRELELELELELLELRIVLAVLISSLVLDDKEFELPVPLPVAVG